MASFCKNCGSALSKDGKCTSCGSAVETPDTKKNKKVKKTKSKADKGLTAVIRILIVILVLVIAGGLTVGGLVYFNVINIPVLNDMFVAYGMKDAVVPESQKGDPVATEPEPEPATTDETETPTEPVEVTTAPPYEVTPPNADEYFSENTTVSSQFAAADAKGIHTEKDAYKNLSDRGFTQYAIMAEYDMNGTYTEAYEISKYSSTPHPMYQTYYTTKTGDLWMILEINGVVMANPLSFNQYADMPLVISETGNITSYDSTLNKFYVNVPHEDVMLVKKIEKINTETLEKLTAEEIAKL